MANHLSHKTKIPTAKEKDTTYKKKKTCSVNNKTTETVIINFSPLTKSDDSKKMYMKTASQRIIARSYVISKTDKHKIIIILEMAHTNTSHQLIYENVTFQKANAYPRTQKINFKTRNGHQFIISLVPIFVSFTHSCSSSINNNV